MHSSTVLPVRGAVTLMHGWCSVQFRERGLRVLFIKGPTLAAQELRPDRVSTDVDVLTHPDDFTNVCDLLRGNGWTARPATFAGPFYDDHSISFTHPNWPCDIDVHSRYPGFLADPRAVFDCLWSGRTHLRFAEVDCFVCSRAASSLIMGLHALRGAARGSRHERELNHLVDGVVFDPAELQEISDTAAVTGCTESARPLLERLGLPPSRMASASVDAAALRDWRIRTDASDSPIWVWLNAFRHTRGPRRILVVWRALWPTRSDLESESGSSPTTRRERAGMRVGRLSRGLVSAARLARQRVGLRRRSGRRAPRE